MFGMKRFLLLLVAVVLMAASIDASVVYGGERQLKSSKKAGSPKVGEMSLSTVASTKAKGSKKGAHTDSGAPMTKGEPKGQPKGEPKGQPKGEPKGQPKGEPKGQPKGEPNDGMNSIPSAPIPPPNAPIPPPNAPIPPPNAPVVHPPTDVRGSKKGSKKGYGDHGEGKGGKGTKKGSKKDSKRSSTGSSSESSPSSSTDGDGGDGSQPSAAPSANGDGKITAVPTSMDSFAVRPAPYALYYTFDRVTINDPSIEDFNELAEVTRDFLNDFFTEKYAQTSIIILDDFLTFLTRSDASARPTIGVFRSVARFNPRSIFYPPRSEIESEIKLAFTEPASQLKYLKMLSDKLPNNNPFKNVASMTYGEPDTVTTSTRVSSFASAGIAAGAAGVVILVAGIALLGRKRSSDDEDESGESFPPAAYKKNSAGSVAGETCAGTTWRSSAGEVNVEDLQDEPLDDDYTPHGSKLNEHY